MSSDEETEFVDELICPRRSQKQPCMRCGKMYTTATLDRFNGMCSRCHDLHRLYHGGFYPQSQRPGEVASSYGFYRHARSLPVTEEETDEEHTEEKDEDAEDENFIEKDPENEGKSLHDWYREADHLNGKEEKKKTEPKLKRKRKGMDRSSSHLKRAKALRSEPKKEESEDEEPEEDVLDSDDDEYVDEEDKNPIETEQEQEHEEEEEEEEKMDADRQKLKSITELRQDIDREDCSEEQGKDTTHAKKS